jgi:hypothetical protein
LAAQTSMSWRSLVMDEMLAGLGRVVSPFVS